MLPKGRSEGRRTRKLLKKLRGESRLQREAVAKADEAEEDAWQHQALRLGDQDAEEAMATQDVADNDYDVRGGSDPSGSDEEKVDSSLGAYDASDFDSSNSSSSTSSSSSSPSTSSAAAVNASSSKETCTTKKAYSAKRTPSVEDAARKKTKAM